MATYVLVHGAWGGSWGYTGLADALREHGHRVFTPSLTGLGERAHLAHGGITLSDHIADVTGLIDCERLEDIILVGHSYGGMVVTGASALRGARIRSLVYLDAFLPENGQSLWDITDDATHHLYIDGQRDSPGLIAPIFSDSTRALTRHPLLTLLEPVKLGGEESLIRNRTYAYAAGLSNHAPPTSFTRFRDQVRHQPGWTLHELATGHVLWADDFAAILALLLAQADSPTE
jgi:pimeloyl-ACP methyl ester carboxylesterase